MDAALRITFPKDLVGSRALIEQLACTVNSQTNTIEQLRREKQELEVAYAELIRRAYQNRSERYLNNPNQLRLDLKDTDGAADAAEGLAEAVEESSQPVRPHTRRRPGRKPRSEALPEHLPRYEVEAAVPEDVKQCVEHGERALIGYDSVESLEFERPKLRVRVTKYAKYACIGDPVDTRIYGGTVPTQSWDRCRNDSVVVLCKIEGWGHVWPGPYFTARLPADDPLFNFDAAEIIWNFFKRFP